MRFLKLGVLILVALMLAGCTCRARKAGDSNIATAEEGRELKDINFAFDSYELSPMARDTLQKNSDWLKANADRKVQIEGHCDERGTNEYNMVLGKNRARSAMEYLRSLGIDASRMSTVSYGEELPLDPRHNEEAWAKNRRGHFTLQ